MFCDFFIIKSLFWNSPEWQEAPPDPRIPKKSKKKRKVFSAKKPTFFKGRFPSFEPKTCCRLWMILRYCNINPIFDTEFSPGVRIFNEKQAAISSQASFQNIVSHCSKTALFLVKCSFTAVRVNILKTRLGTYRSLFLMENSNSRRKFNIKEGFMLQYLKITQSQQKVFGSKLENRGP